MRKFLIGIVFVLICFSSMVIANTLAYWRFENNLNATVGGNLTYSGSSTNDFTTTDLPTTPFVNTGAYMFDGNTDKLTGSLNFQSLTQYTIEFFMKPSTTSPSGRMTIISKPGSSPYPVYIDLVATGVMVGTVNEGSNYPYTVGNSYTNGWQHVAAVYNGANPVASRYKFYVNGVEIVLARVGSLPTSATDNGGLLMLGNWADEARPYSGLLDEVRISDIALDPSLFLIASVPEPTGFILFGLSFCLFFWAAKR